ncbi:MAG: methyl-accepting chemotaxis protein [bacterium]
MNDRPSTSILSIGERLTRDASSRSLRWRLVVVAGLFATIVLGAVAYTGLLVLRRAMAGDEDARLINAASLSKQLVERVLSERTRQVDLISSAPSVVLAARKGAEAARQRGLPKMQVAEIEQLFKVTRSQQVDEDSKRYLNDLLSKLDIAEVMVTDEYGYNAVTTSPSSDFVQSDEGWWQTAWANGLTTAQATADAATQRTVVELAGVIRDRGAKVGVVKVKFGLAAVDSVLVQGSTRGGSLRVDLVDSLGKVIASSAPSTRFKLFPAFAAASAHEASTAFLYTSDSTLQRASVVTTNAGRWRVIAHMNETEASRGYRVVRWSLIGGLAVMLILIVTSLVFAGRFIERRITRPAQELAIAAEAVAAGDLSMQVNEIGGDDEIGRLARAVSAMILELRRLAGALNESASETGSMTAEITASSEEMSASAGEIAHTAADLSQQANVMAETIQTLAGSSEHLVGVAAQLDSGAREGVERNTQLRALALENRSRLDDSSRSLTALSTDVEANATAIDSLAQASEEVRTFVSLVQKLARQSKLLALNAAMEAARAGDHGHGFAVVAEEVRRLAAMSSDAAERTERVVSGVLHGIQQSRNSSERTVETVRAVRGATEEGSRSFGQIEKAVAEADGWTSSIQHASAAANDIARDLSGKLDSLASGTESFAAAMEEVAASSEEQSASTEQIAAAAATLSGAADRLNKIVANLRLEQIQIVVPVPSPRTSGPLQIPPDVAYRMKPRPVAKAG